MSKKVNDKIPSESNVSEAQGDTFSFLELNKFLANENREKEHTAIVARNCMMRRSS